MTHTEAADVTACRSCGSTLTRAELDAIKAVNCCPERAMNEVIERDFGTPATLPHARRNGDAGAKAMSDVDINALFSGYGMALRRENDPPIPGEPLMSIAVAKEIVRPHFARLKMLEAARDTPNAEVHGAYLGGTPLFRLARAVGALERSGTTFVTLRLSEVTAMLRAVDALQKIAAYQRGGEICPGPTGDRDDMIGLAREALREPNA